MDASALTEYSTLQLSSNNPSLDRTHLKAGHSEANSLTKPERNKKTQQAPGKTLSPEQLKTQLEHNLAQKIANPNEVYANDKHVNKEIKKVDSETQNTEADKTNRFSKFGIRVLPIETKMDNVTQPARSPKSAENSQNDNNINLEKKMETEGIDEVDKKKIIGEAPPVKRREKINKPLEPLPQEVPQQVPQQPEETETFERENDFNSSGIKRDKAGIPQEIPDHMMNAAVAARKNRKSVETPEKIQEPEENEMIKSPKKLKGKAPAPPELTKSETKPEVPERLNNVSVKLNFTDNLDEISPSPVEEKEEKVENVEEDINKNVNKTDDSIAELKEIEKSSEDKEYCSDSDIETDNHSSVNTIELNSSDITIHHAEAESEVKDRKTASTGDLSKIHKTQKSNTGTLERAQSLDITDTGIPLTKKRKASKDEDELKSDSDDSFCDNTIKNKEPRLSLALDGLDTFQRNRLKKSTEWGNLEDAIMTLDKMEVDTPTDIKIEFTEAKSPIKFDFGAKNTEFGSSVTNINDNSVVNDSNFNVSVTDDVILKDELNNTPNITEEVKIVQVKNQLWPDFDSTVNTEEVENVPKENNINISSYHLKMKSNDLPFENTDENKAEASSVQITNLEVKNQSWPDFLDKTEVPEMPKTETVIVETKIKTDIPISNTEPLQESNISSTKINSEPTFSLKAQFEEKLNGKLKSLEPEENLESTTPTSTQLPNVNIKTQDTSIFHPGKSSQNFIFAEKYASSNDNYYNSPNKLYDTNISDDIKVSRHSLGSLERPKSDVLKSVNKLKMQSLISSDQGGVSNITITENKPAYENGVQDDTKQEYDMSTASELYTTAVDSAYDNNNDVSISNSSDIKNITIAETNYDLLNESPSSLTIDTSSDGPESIKSHTLTYVTEIQVSTPTNGTSKNVAEIEVISKPEVKKPEEVLKRLPEMKFTTSSYESPKIPEKRLSQIELLRSNFEKSPLKTKPIDSSPAKSRIPVATSKVDFKTSPERKDGRFGEHDVNEEKEIVEIMSSAVHSTPLVPNQRYQNKNPSRNVTVTSIRTSSKIPSGSHISSYSSKPPVPSKPNESHETEIRTSNGGSESFKQWVFNPGESSVTSIVVDNKEHHK